MSLAFLKRDIPRRPALVALALVAAAGVVAGRDKPAVDLVEEKPARVLAQTEKRPMAGDLDLGKLRRPQAAAPQSDPFAPRSFAPEPRQAAASQAPSAPPLPFTYFGRLTENGKTEVFVMRGEDLISVAAGQKLGADYRVDSVGASSIRFTYLPLKTVQSLELGEAGG